MNAFASSLRLPLRKKTAPASGQDLPAATHTVLALLRQIQGGSVQIQLPDSEPMLFGHGEVRADLVVHDQHLFERVLGEGDIGFGEAYVDGDWESSDPAALLLLLVVLAAAQVPCLRR